MASFRPAPDLRCPICGAINYPPVQHFKRGDLLAGYSILKRIEANRTSETYLARSFNNRTIINLQTFSSKTIESGITAEYYLGAMKQWMKVRQPNIAKVLDAGRSSTGTFFAASSPIKGVTLEDRLWRGGAVELKPALHLAISISRILEWLWNEHGLLYGQLTPRNILLMPDKNIILSHMALAPILKNRPPGILIREFITSTPGFTCPEQFSSPDTLDLRGDMYSLGATLYHMLTGKPPFACLNTGEIITQQRSPSLADPRFLRPDLPDEFVWLLEILLAHDPKDRFDNWESLIKILTSLDHHQTLSQPQPLKSHSVLIHLPPSDIAQIPMRPRRKQVQSLFPHKSQPKKKDYFGIILSITIIISAVLIIFFALSTPRFGVQPVKISRVAQTPSFTTSQANEPAGSTADPISKYPTPAPEPSKFMSLLVETRKLARQNPLQFEEILNRYGKLLAMAQTDAPLWVTGLQEQVQAIELAMAAPLDDAEQAIRVRFREFENGGQFQAGMDWLEQYSGPFVEKTKQLRLSLSDTLKKQKDTAKQEN